MARTPPRSTTDARDARPRTPLGRKILYASAVVWTVLFAWFGWRAYARWRATRPAPPGNVRCEAPLGEVAEFDEFRWTFALPPGGSFRLEIYADDPAVTIPVARADRLVTNAWRPGPERLLEWPRRIEWLVRVMDAQGQAVDHGRARASRRP